MQAVLVSNQAPGGKRSRLEDNLPLGTPYVVQIFPIYACNFKCNYCHFSIEKRKRKFVTDQISLDLDLYKKCVDDMCAFPEKIRTLRFVGMGEPLLHKDLPKMIAYTKEKQIANRVEIITNASLLTKEMSDALIEAGLDRMVISIQGTTAKSYEEVSHIQLDYDAFVEGIRYFYQNKKDTHVYIKVVDVALEDEADKQRFFDIFGDICDSIGIETAIPLYPDVEFNEVLAQQNQVTQYGTTVQRTDICPQPFYLMQINPDGKVVGCHSISPYPEIFGDCNVENVCEIWNGTAFNQFRRKMLDGKNQVCECCKECTLMEYRTFEEDRIDAKKEMLKAIYK